MPKLQSHRFVLSAVFAFAAFNAHASPWQPSPGHSQINIWPATPPDALPSSPPETSATTKPTELVAGKPWTYVSNVTTPTLTLYSPEQNTTHTAIVVFPGGGYKILAIDLEGTEICDWLTSKGITCILLKYRVPDSGPAWDDRLKRHIVPKAPTALQDAQRTLSLARFHAKEWNIDPHKIGVIGFSAGGHMVAQTSTMFKDRAYKPVDEADKQSCRPDFAAAIYPGHLWTEKEGLALNPEIHVASDTSPTFLLQAEDDYVDGVNQSLVYYIALKNAKVPTELHLYAHGGHAFGLRPTNLPISHWPSLMEQWLATIGMIPQ